jgi:hypothetical protein
MNEPYMVGKMVKSMKKKYSIIIAHRNMVLFIFTVEIIFYNFFI